MEEPCQETWFVYLLRCVDGSLYTGITKDIERRCRQHDKGTASRYTRGRRPVALVYHETQASRSLALKREAAIKALPRRAKISLIRRTTIPGQHRRPRSAPASATLTPLEP